MDLLQDRTPNDTDILKARFIRQKLQETANDIKTAQDKKMSSSKAEFKSSFWQDRNFSITDNEMQFTHLKVHRYIDMRRRHLKDGSIINKKNYSIHNRIVMGHYSQLTKELIHGFTDEVKQNLRQLGN